MNYKLFLCFIGFWGTIPEYADRVYHYKMKYFEKVDGEILSLTENGRQNVNELMETFDSSKQQRAMWERKELKKKKAKTLTPFQHEFQNRSSHK